MMVLVAEDEKEIAAALKRNLLAEGHQVAIALDGEAALRVIETMPLDAILLDWRMPKLSGVDVCKKVRAAGVDVPIILITALEDIAHKVEALNLGADDYITKPFSFAEVSARLRAVCRRFDAHRKAISFSGFELDIEGRLLTRGDVQQKLPEKEFDLLRYFLAHKNKIIGREELARNVWLLPMYPRTNYIEVTVKNLRKRLERLHDFPLIRTVYGEGYLFVEE